MPSPTVRGRPPRKLRIDVPQWLGQFRKSLPHEQRQALIDLTAPDDMVRDLAAAATLDERRARYPLVIYILAARFLRDPATAGVDALARQRLLDALAPICDRAPANVFRDMRWMLARLASDHRHWEQRTMSAADAGVVGSA